MLWIDISCLEGRGGEGESGAVVCYNCLEGRGGEGESGTVDCYNC